MFNGKAQDAFASYDFHLKWIALCWYHSAAISATPICDSRFSLIDETVGSAVLNVGDTDRERSGIARPAQDDGAILNGRSDDGALRGLDSGDRSPRDW